MEVLELWKYYCNFSKYSSYSQNLLAIAGTGRFGYIDMLHKISSFMRRNGGNGKQDSLC